LEDVAGSEELVHSQHEFVEVALQTTIEGDSCAGGSTLMSSQASATEGAQIEEAPCCVAGLAKVSADKHVELLQLLCEN